MRSLSFGIVMAALVACQAGPDAQSKSTETPSPGDAVQSFGEPLSSAKPQPLAAGLKAPEDYSDTSVIVEGVVRKVCQAKGCWMEIATGSEPEAQGARIVFKDYGFFVPKDSAGSHALAEGRIEASEVSADHVAHLEAEGADMGPKNAEGKVQEIRMVATGVELRAGG